MVWIYCKLPIMKTQEDIQQDHSWCLQRSSCSRCAYRNQHWYMFRHVPVIMNNINYMYIQWILRLPPHKKNIRSQETGNRQVCWECQGVQVSRSLLLEEILEIKCMEPFENYGKTVIYVICSISTLQHQKWMASLHTKCTAYEHWGMNASHITWYHENYVEPMEGQPISVREDLWSERERSLQNSWHFWLN